MSSSNVYLKKFSFFRYLFEADAQPKPKPMLKSQAQTRQPLTLNPLPHPCPSSLLHPDFPNRNPILISSPHCRIILLLSSHISNIPGATRPVERKNGRRGPDQHRDMGREEWAGRCDESSVDSTCGRNEGVSACDVDSPRKQKKEDERRRGFLRSVVGCIIMFGIHRLSTMRIWYLPLAHITLNDAIR
jgi:hypothetical protein